jgi:mannose-6-phosphate isomerase-like protein (cupin superfamily)
MLIKKSETKKHSNSPKCIAYEYPFTDKDINIAFIEIKGRYPDKDRVTNKVCKEIVFVVKGKGKIEVDGKELLISEGDSIFIQPSQKYFFEGNLEIITSCHPTWYSEQHIECD